MSKGIKKIETASLVAWHAEKSQVELIFCQFINASKDRICTAPLATSNVGATAFFVRRTQGTVNVLDEARMSLTDQGKKQIEKTPKFAGLIAVTTSSVLSYNTRHGKQKITCFNMCECSAEKEKGLLYASDDPVKMCEASRKWHAHVLSETQGVKTQVVFVSANTAFTNC